MASKDPSTRARTETVKADLRSISTCSNATVATLQDLLSKNDAPPQKENARAKAQTTVRRKAAAATTTTADTAKPAANLLAPRERYILATEVANTTLKSLADALKSPPTVPVPPPSASSRQKPTPSEDARKPAKARTGHAKSASVSKRPLAERSASQMANSSQKPAARRSSSYSSFLTPGPDAGLVATAECARIAFAYLGTPEATKVLGKGSPELQLENGVLALVGKLIALGLDNLAIKEMRILKKRLEKYLGLQGVPPASECVKRSAPSTVPVEKESLASLLDFGTVERESIALPLIASLQTHALRLIAKLNRPRIVEATWEYLQFSNPSSPVNLICHTATTPTGQAKAARQLESLAQTILALCPSISSSHDEKPLQPSPETALLLQQLAFRVRRRWWALAKHQGNEEQEILEPFTKCLVAFTRRSQLPASKKYRLAESLYAELIGDQQQPQAIGRKTGAVDKTLSALAQSAGFSEEALRWLGSSETSSPSTASEAKRIARLVRIATLSIEAYAQGNTHTGNSGLEERITDALDALKGNLGGSSVDLDHLFMEVNALRRATTRLLIARSPASLDSGTSATSEQRAVAIVASSVHFSTRFVGAKVPQTSESTVQQRHSERITTVWKCIKSIIDSVVVCCKQNILTEDQWKELDVMLQECSHILQRLEERVESGSGVGCQDHEQLQSLIVKLSTAYWAVNLSLRKSKADIGCIITAMQRSISLLLSTSQDTKNAGHLTMKLEQLGDTLESLAHARSSRDAFEQCIRAHLESDASEHLSTSTPKASLQIIFDVDGPLSILARVLKSHHRTYIKFGLTNSDELAFFDDCELLPGIRGALLEWQLSLYLQTLGRNRQWDSTLNSSISTLVLRLQEMYEFNKYPVRRLRLTSGLLQLFQSQENILPKDSLPPKLPSMNPSDIAGSEDEGLARFWPHLNALCSLKLSMQLESPPTTTLRECFSTWESLIDSAPSWEQVVNCLDNPETWIQDVEACVEFLNAKGEEYLALPVLQLLVKVGDLRRSSDTSPLVLNLCSLGLQFLRLGYTGKAGMAFAKAEALLERQPLSTEARIRWCIAYAEYLARIGNTTKCLTVMSTAENHALTDRQFMDLAKPSTTLSGRLRYNKILADAAYVHSLLATAAGSYTDAARHARQCVTLNRRIWAALESRSNMKKPTLLEDTDSSVDGASRATFDPLGSIRNEKGTPLVMSVTHDALCGADFWSLVPALYRGLMQHSQIFAAQGLLHEAIYVAEQAQKIASATKSVTLITDNASWRADCWAQSGRPDKAEPLLEALNTDAARKCLSLVGYQSAVARVHHWKGQYTEEITSYGVLDQLLQDLTSPVYVRGLDNFASEVSSLAEQMSRMTVETTETLPIKAVPTTRGRKPASKPAQRRVAKAAPRLRVQTGSEAAAETVTVVKPKVGGAVSSDTPSVEEQCSVLCAFQAGIMHRSVLANLLQDDIVAADRLLEQVERVQNGISQDSSHLWATFKTMLAHTFKQIADNIAVNTLTESTIAFPAVGLQERRMSDSLTSKRSAFVSSTASKSGRAKKQIQVDFTDTLRNARDRLMAAHASAASKGPNHMFQQISMALGHVTVLLSAVSGGELGRSLHPLYAAYMAEIPKCNALRLTQGSIESEKEPLSRDECLRWPTLSCSDFALTNVSDFQTKYVDIIPKTWTAVSLALNDTRDELYITRFESGLSPFVLRLPLARHASREMDEEVFSFEDGKHDFDETIELSDFSTRTAKDITSREARQQWWTEREALDTRLHELLLNIENIWLGGFRGVFSQHERDSSLLARFRKSLENILNQHLPSRRKKTQPKKVVLDARVLELFIGLGDATDEELDLDEALMDLIYFVVDVLHFNGERNAYDEIDFDAMVVETHEALSAYHSASQATTESPRHVILILDNNLHGFPWEALPCLEKLSISRLPSLAALRERLLAAKAPTNRQDAAPGHYIRAETGGASILNPSGDLSHTTKTLKPRLDELQGPWAHMTNRAPTEKEFEASLRDKDLVLYFGHGSGAQFLRSKSVRRLYPGHQEEHSMKPGCATTFLFGCSSVHLTENGIYEPSGMLASYLTAGAPAVVGMLWDVTDKDCDRFAVKAGELWGLWPEPQEEIEMKAPKTPAKKAKGKSRVAQLVDEVEGTRGPGSARKRKKGKEIVEDAGLAADRRRGMGLDECVRDARQACVLRYLNGAAAVVYGIPVYLE